jgi:hypothetical protein
MREVFGSVHNAVGLCDSLRGREEPVLADLELAPTAPGTSRDAPPSSRRTAASALEGQSRRPPRRCPIRTKPAAGLLTARFEQTEQRRPGPRQPTVHRQPVCPGYRDRRKLAAAPGELRAPDGSPRRARRGRFCPIPATRPPAERLLLSCLQHPGSRQAPGAQSPAQSARRHRARFPRGASLRGPTSTARALRGMRGSRLTSLQAQAQKQGTR